MSFDALGDITPFLQRKYAIQQQNADAATTTANSGAVRSYASAGLDTANAGQVAADSAARRGLLAAQTGNVNVDTQKQKYLLPVSQALGQRLPGSLGYLGLGGAGPYSAGAPAASPFTFGSGLLGGTETKDNASLLAPMQPLNLGAPTPPVASSLTPSLAPATSSSLLDLGGREAANVRTSRGLPSYKASADDLSKPLGFAKGTSKVPGKGDGTVDKVPAKLAPGEAVLNKGAAEHIGRDTIEHLNQIGMMKMGMTPSAPQAAGKGMPKGKSKPQGKNAMGGHGDSGGMPVQGFAEGTSNVQPAGSYTLPSGVGMYARPGLTPETVMDFARGQPGRGAMAGMGLAAAAGSMDYLRAHGLLQQGMP